MRRLIVAIGEEREREREIRVRVLRFGGEFIYWRSEGGEDGFGFGSGLLFWYKFGIRTWEVDLDLQSFYKSLF